MRVKSKVTLPTNFRAPINKLKCLVAVCPSFEIKADTLELIPGDPKFSAEYLLAAFLQIGAREVCAVIGYAWLYWDYLLLDSLISKGEGVGLMDSKSEQKFSRFPKDHPKAEAIKKKAQAFEKQWFSEQKELAEYKDKFIFSGDLLDNPECQALFKNLNDFCESPKGKPLAETLALQTNKFIESYLTDTILRRDDLVCKYSKKITPRALVEQYMREYTRFEFAAFFYFFSRQGCDLILTDFVDKHLRKAISMVMSHFKEHKEKTRLNMQVSTIEFSEEQASEEVVPPSRLSEEEKTLGQASEKVAHPRRLSAEEETRGRHMRVIAELCRSPILSTDDKHATIQEMLQAKPVTPTYALAASSFWKINKHTVFGAVIGTAATTMAMVVSMRG